MEAPRRVRRLFWKLLLALTVSMLVSFAATSVYFRIFGPTHHDDGKGPLMILGLFPVVPLIVASAAFFVTGLLVAWYLSRPLHHLSWALRQASAGRLDTRVSPLMGGRSDEITDLAMEFDRMAAQLQQLTESRQVLLHDMSHELRSPLGRMQAAIGLFRQSQGTAADALDRIEREVGRLDALIGELLTLHRLEAGPSDAAERSRVDLIELLLAIVEDADFEARHAGSVVECKATGSFVTEVNGELMYRAFENVVRNAVKYTAPGTTVSVLAETADAGRTLVVRVLDRGPGVPAHQLQKIFEPFVRVEGSEHVRGVGLGLAITQRALHMHGGSVQASLRADGGLEVRMQVPVQASAGGSAAP